MHSFLVKGTIVQVKTHKYWWKQIVSSKTNTEKQNGHFFIINKSNAFLNIKQRVSICLRFTRWLFPPKDIITGDSKFPGSNYLQYSKIQITHHFKVKIKTKKYCAKHTFA